MYARIFGSIFDSSINEQDPVVFKVWVCMLTLGGEDGIVDVTRESIASRTRLPQADANRAIAVLEAPDPNSRCADHEGRRILPLPGRPYGWTIVTASHYGKIRTAEDRRAYQREYMEDYRANGPKKGRKKSARKQPVNSRKQLLGQLAHIDVAVPKDKTETDDRHACSERDIAFEKLWALVPRKEGKLEAQKHFDALLAGGCKADREQKYAANLELLSAELEKAIRNYSATVRAEKTERRYIKTGGPLFFNFRDYVETPSSTSRPCQGTDVPEEIRAVVDAAKREAQ